jgi:hypothetical protein
MRGPKLTIASDVAVFCEDSNDVGRGTREGAIGIALMKRHVVPFDYPGKRMILAERPKRARESAFARKDAAATSPPST